MCFYFTPFDEYVATLTLYGGCNTIFKPVSSKIVTSGIYLLIVTTVCWTPKDRIRSKEIFLLSIKKNLSWILLIFPLSKINVLSKMFLHAFWFAHEKPIACTAIDLPWLFVLNDTISTESSITVFLAALFWIRQKLIANFTNEAWLNRIDSMLFFQPSQFPKIFCPIFANFLNFIPIPLQFITLLLPAGFYPLIHII